VIGSLPVGSEARLVRSYTVVLKPGSANVKTVDNTNNLRLKVGDKVNLLLYSGEGNWLAWWPALKEPVSIPERSRRLSVSDVKRPETETWYEISADKARGFSKEFPFSGCH
jgi:hypothetical protein